MLYQVIILPFHLPNASILSLFQRSHPNPEIRGQMLQYQKAGFVFCLINLPYTALDRFVYHSNKNLMHIDNTDKGTKLSFILYTASSTLECSITIFLNYSKIYLYISDIFG